MEKSGNETAVKEKEIEVESENEEETEPVAVEEIKPEREEAIPKEKRPIKKRGLRKKIEIIEQKKEDYDGERFLTVRFYPKLLSAAKWKRAKKAIKILQEKILKYVKNVEDPISGKKIRVKKPTLWISPEMNALIWSRGAKNPPRRVRVRVLYKIVSSEDGEVELRVFPFQ